MTGAAPFGGETALDTLDRVRRESPVPPSRVNPRVARDLEVICLKCLEKDPAAAVLVGAAAFRGPGPIPGGEPIAARATGMLERGWLWCRRNPRLAGAISSTVGALIAAAVISMAYAVEQSRARKWIGHLLDESKQLTHELRRQGDELKESLAHFEPIGR